MNSKIKSKLFNEMESYFGRDKRRIEHAHKVAEFAEKLLQDEASRGINELVVIAAAVLHDIGIHACEKKYGSTAGHLQEKEGPAIARHIMEKLDFDERIIKEVCDIIASHHSPKENDTINFKVLYDADWLVNLSDEVDTEDKEKLEKAIDKIFLTNTGKELAKATYIRGLRKTRVSKKTH